MAFDTDQPPEYLRSLRRVFLALATIVLIALFLVWRIDNARVEQLRVAMVDRFVPSFDWALAPLASAGRMVSDLQSYARVYEQNEELRRELVRMQGWREAALQLEQKNAQLLALNNVRLSPRTTFVTAEVLADSGSPFSQSAMLNVGRIDGVTDGAAVVDGRGLVGRIAGLGERSARVLFLSDGSSRVPAHVLPGGARALVAGANGPAPPLDFLDSSDRVRPGDRVVSSGDGGVLPPDLPVGRVIVGNDGRPRVQLAADFARMSFVRVLRHRPAPVVRGPGDLIGPLRAAPPATTARVEADQ